MVDGILAINKHDMEFRVGESLVRCFSNIAIIAGLACAVPAIAFAVPQPVHVPEPESLTLVATALGGAVGAYAIRQWRRRK